MACTPGPSIRHARYCWRQCSPRMNLSASNKGVYTSCQSQLTPTQSSVTRNCLHHDVVNGGRFRYGHTRDACS